MLICRFGTKMGANLYMDREGVEWEMGIRVDKKHKEKRTRGKLLYSDTCHKERCS